MAIVNTLQKCLESPYLFEDPEAPSQVKGLLDRADQRLEAARSVHSAGQADLTDANFLAYEAMFCCLRALVYAKGYREAGLRCLMLACEYLYVRNEQLDISHLHAFERVQGLKLPPARTLEAAVNFVRRTHELVGR